MISLGRATPKGFSAAKHRSHEAEVSTNKYVLRVNAEVQRSEKLVNRPMRIWLVISQKTIRFFAQKCSVSGLISELR